MDLTERWELLDEVKILRARVAELEAQIAAHERVCAGTWVPVGERLPEPEVEVPVINADGKMYVAPFDPVYEVWLELAGVTHWLDARLPTSSGEG